MRAVEIIASYEALIQKAHKLTYFYTGNDGDVRLETDGVYAWIITPEASESYGDPCLDREKSDPFPVALLDATDEACVAWKAEKDRKITEQYEIQRGIEARQREAQERATLEALKKKYGG